MALRERQTQGSTIVFEDNTTLVFDAVFVQTPSYDSNFSRHPTESGRSLTSHIQNLPVTLALVVSFTDTPLREGETSAAGRALGLVDRLILARDRREIFTLVTTRGSYESLAIKHIDDPYTPLSGLAHEINIQLEEVVVVDSLGASVIIPDELIRREENKDQGKKTGQRDQDDPPKASLAKRILTEQYRNGNVQRLSNAIGL